MANRTLGFLFLWLGTLLAAGLLLAGAPLWAFYLAPLATVPVMLLLQHADQPGDETVPSPRDGSLSPHRRR